jgi:6-phosphogluconolactonase (cycloisomerase 2 family)
MKMEKWACLMLAAAPLLAGCSGFWDAPSSTDTYALTNSGNMTVAPGDTGSSTITVTPASSFTGAVALTCAATTTPTSAANAATCSLSPTSVTLSSTGAQTSTLTVATASGTTTGTYDFTVTGTSGTASQTTVVCAEVTSGTDTCSATASTSGNFYILTGNTLTGYSISGGILTPLSNSSYTVTGASAVAMGPNGNYLYVATASGIIPFTVNTSSGLLTKGTAFGDQLGEAIAVDPSGKWLLEASLTGVLFAYPITTSGAQDTGRSTQTSAFLASSTVQPGGIAVSSKGLVAVALGTTGTQMFPFSSGSAVPIGTAYPIKKPWGSGGAVAVAADQINGLLYIGETSAFNPTTNSGALRVLTVSSNSVTELPYTAPYAPLGTGPHAILPTSTGGYVYVASWQSGAAGVITGYSVTSSALTPLSTTVGTGTEPNGLVLDHTGDFMLAVNSSGTTFDAYTVSSGGSGELTSLVTDTSIASPIAIVAAP